MVTVDNSTSLFIFFVSPRPTGFQQGTKVSLTHRPEQMTETPAFRNSLFQSKFHCLTHLSSCIKF